MKQLLLMACVFAFNLFAQTDNDAMVLQHNGIVKLIDADRSSIVKAGTLIDDGDSLWLDARATVTILDVTGAQHIYRQPARVRISRQSQTDPLAVKFIRQMASINEWSKTAAEKMTVRSGNATETFFQSPRNSKLLNKPQRLSWIENTVQKFDVAVRCYDNDYTFDDTVTGNTYLLSEKITIQHGTLYHWYVKPHYETTPQIPAAVWFSVMNESEKQQWLSESNHLKTISDTTTVEYKLLYAQLLLQYEMNQDAKIILDEILKMEPYQSTAQILMAVTCERLEMIPEALHALKLSQK